MYWANLLHIYQPPGQKQEIIHKVVKESYDKILRVLESNPKVKITLNICASLTEQLIEYGHKNIVDRIKKLVEQGQIELVGSAKYHPILPFLSKTEVVRQIKLNEETNKKYFGEAWRPKGFFLPELAYSKKVGRLIQELSYEWIVLDEVACCGKFGKVDFSKNYILKYFLPWKKNNALKIIFRNTGLSNLFFGKWLDSTSKFFSSVIKDGRSNEFLITAFDGENLGHHQKHLIYIWSELLDKDNVKTITYSEYLNLLQVESIRERSAREVEPVDSSWSTGADDLSQGAPYPLWADPDNRIQKLQRQLADLVIKFVNKSENSENYEKARRLLDKSLASDQYWWASGRPWWSSSMIKRFIEYFNEIVVLLSETISDKDQKKVKKLIQEIFKELQKRK